MDETRILKGIEDARSIAREIVAFKAPSPLDSETHRGYRDSWYEDRPHRLVWLVPVLRAAEMALPGFVTLDPFLVRAILGLRKGLGEYVRDDSRRRPHNVLMIAPPGSGKSHLARRLAATLGARCAVGDLSIGTGHEILNFVVNEARNFKAQDLFPLIFLDESDTNNGSLIPSLLSLLWDGEYSASGQILKVGRCIIVCAVSDCEFVSNIAFSNQTETPPKAAIPKLADFLSRFDAGALQINSLADQGRELDRLVIAAHLIARRFPSVGTVSIGILQFLAQVPVKHEARSIEFLINMIPVESLKPWPFVAIPSKGDGIPSIDGKLNVRFARLLSGDSLYHSPLCFHIDKNDYQLAAELWGRLSRNIEPVQICLNPIG